MEGSSCCVDVLYTQPKIENLNQLNDCDVLLLPETQSEGPYFNPLFFPVQCMLLGMLVPSRIITEVKSLRRDLPSPWLWQEGPYLELP